MQAGAALQADQWQSALIAALARGRRLQDARADVGISEERFHEQLGVDPAFRNACREAIETARAELARDLALIEEIDCSSAPPSRPRLARQTQVLPKWAVLLLMALLNGRSLDAAFIDVGVDESHIRAEERRNQLFRLVWRSLNTIPLAGRLAAYDALLDRVIALAMVGTRVFPSPANWIGSFFQVWRENRSPTEAMRTTGVSEQQVEEERRRNSYFALAYELLTLVQLDVDVYSRQQEQDAANLQEQQSQLASILRSGIPLLVACAAVDVAPRVALTWIETVPEIRAAYEEQERQKQAEKLTREAEPAAAFLTALVESGEPRIAARQAGWSWTAAQERRRLVPEFALAWDKALEEVRARETPLAEAMLAALAQGIPPRTAVEQVQWTWEKARQRRRLDPAFARDWKAAQAAGKPARTVRRKRNTTRGQAMLKQILDGQFYEIVPDDGEHTTELLAELRAAAKSRGMRIYRKRDPQRLLVKLLALASDQ